MQAYGPQSQNVKPTIFVSVWQVPRVCPRNTDRRLLSPLSVSRALSRRDRSSVVVEMGGEDAVMGEAGEVTVLKFELFPAPHSISLCLVEGVPVREQRSRAALV